MASAWLSSILSPGSRVVLAKWLHSLPWSSWAIQLAPSCVSLWDARFFGESLDLPLEDVQKNLKGAQDLEQYGESNFQKSRLQ